MYQAVISRKNDIHHWIFCLESSETISFQPCPVNGQGTNNTSSRNSGSGAYTSFGHRRTTLQSQLNWHTTFSIVITSIRRHNRCILFIQFTLFYTAKCLYITLFIFLISSHLASKVDTSAIQKCFSFLAAGPRTPPELHLWTPLRTSVSQTP